VNELRNGSFYECFRSDDLLLEVILILQLYYIILFSDKLEFLYIE